MSEATRPPLAREPVLGADGKVLPFRRRSSAVRVRRRNPWLALLGAAARAAFLVAVPAAVALWLFVSPTFALARIEVAGNRQVQASEIERALAPFRGANLLRLPLASVEQAVARHPWIARATVSKRLPDRLRLEVVERLPAALERTPGGFWVLDGEGRRISPWQPGTGGGELLLVSAARASLDPAGGPGIDLRGALAVADELEAAAPDWAATLSEVEALAEDEFRLWLGALSFPLLVRGGTLAERLPELERRYPALAAVDLRFDRRIVFRPDFDRPAPDRKPSESVNSDRTDSERS